MEQVAEVAALPRHNQYHIEISRLGGAYNGIGGIGGLAAEGAHGGGQVAGQVQLAHYFEQLCFGYRRIFFLGDVQHRNLGVQAVE